MKYFLKSILILGVLCVLYASLSIFPMVVLFRGANQTPLLDSLPDISESHFSSFEGAKLSPLENYHSGLRSEVFYLYGKKKCRLKLEYFSSDSNQTRIEVAFIQGHRFIHPKFLNSVPYQESNGIFTFDLASRAPLIVLFEVEMRSIKTDDFRVVINSLRVPFYNPMDSVVFLNSPNQFHANIVGRIYRMNDVPAWRPVDVVKKLPASREKDISVLKRNRSLAIVNRDNRVRSFVICQPNLDPLYVQVKPFESATFRDMLSNDSTPVLVLEGPHSRLENFLGFPGKKEEFAFYFNRKGSGESH